MGHLEKIDAEVLRYSAIQQGESLWPERWTVAGLEERQQDDRRMAERLQPGPAHSSLGYLAPETFRQHHEPSLSVV